MMVLRIPSPLRGRHRVGVIISSVISKCYHPPPNPLPSREGEFWGQEILKIPETLHYPRIAFRSSSGVVMGMMLKFFTSTSMTLGVRKAGREGPRRMFLIPR